MFAAQCRVTGFALPNLPIQAAQASARAAPAKIARAPYFMLWSRLLTASAGPAPPKDNPPMKLEVAQKIVALALAHARARNMLPLCVAVLDARSATRALAAEDGTSIKRSNVAIGKAHGALAMGLGSRTLAKR